MKTLEDGSIYLEKGERVPYKCPRCRRVIPFFETTDVIRCRCGFEGEVEDFSETEYRIQKPN